MATPVTDLRLRLRNAGISEEQADAVFGAFEALSGQIANLAKRLQSLITGQRIQIGSLLLVAAAILAPYMASGK